MLPSRDLVAIGVAGLAPLTGRGTGPGAAIAWAPLSPPGWLGRVLELGMSRSAGEQVFVADAGLAGTGHEEVADGAVASAGIRVAWMQIEQRAGLLELDLLDQVRAHP